MHQECYQVLLILVCIYSPICQVIHKKDCKSDILAPYLSENGQNRRKTARFMHF